MVKKLFGLCVAVLLLFFAGCSGDFSFEENNFDEGLNLTGNVESGDVSANLSGNVRETEDGFDADFEARIEEKKKDEPIEEIMMNNQGFVDFKLKKGEVVEVKNFDSKTIELYEIVGDKYVFYVDGYKVVFNDLDSGEDYLIKRHIVEFGLYMEILDYDSKGVKLRVGALCQAVTATRDSFMNVAYYNKNGSQSYVPLATCKQLSLNEDLTENLCLNDYLSPLVIEYEGIVVNEFDLICDIDETDFGISSGTEYTFSLRNKTYDITLNDYDENSEEVFFTIDNEQVILVVGEVITIEELKFEVEEVFNEGDVTYARFIVNYVEDELINYYDVKLAMGEGETQKIIYDDKTYEIEMRDIQDDRLLLSINGVIKSLDPYYFENVAGLDVLVEEIVYSGRDSVKSYAQLYLTNGENVLYTYNPIYNFKEDVYSLVMNENEAYVFTIDGKDYEFEVESLSEDDAEIVFEDENGKIIELDDIYEDETFSEFGLGFFNLDWQEEDVLSVDFKIGDDEVINESPKVELALGEGESSTIVLGGKSFKIELKKVVDEEEINLAVNDESMWFFLDEGDELGGLSIIVDAIVEGRSTVKGYASMIITLDPNYNSSPDKCYDGDYGKNYSVKSYITNYHHGSTVIPEYEDRCLHENQFALPGQEDILFEGYCENGIGKLTSGSNAHHCDHGCFDGVCQDRDDYMENFRTYKTMKLNETYYFNTSSGFYPITLSEIISDNQGGKFMIGFNGTDMELARGETGSYGALRLEVDEFHKEYLGIIAYLEE